jgi:deoxyribonuclease-4
VRAAAGLSKELERSTALGIGACCFHPGADKDVDRIAAVVSVARAFS